MSPTELYLDLLIRTITNTIYGDPPTSRGHGFVYNPKFREVGADWPSMAHSMIGLHRLKNLRDLCLTCIDENIPGDFIETGVWRGGTSILMRGVLVARGDKSRTV